MNHRRRWALLTGSLGGFFSGLTGVGGGALMVPLLTAILRLPQHRAHGTSLLLVTCAAGAGALPYLWRGEIDWTLVGGLLGGSVAGAYLGARAMMRVPERHLQILFGAFLLTVAVRMLVAA